MADRVGSLARSEGVLLNGQVTLTGLRSLLHGSWAEESVYGPDSESRERKLVLQAAAIQGMCSCYCRQRAISSSVREIRGVLLAAGRQSEDREAGLVDCRKGLDRWRCRAVDGNRQKAGQGSMA